MPAINETNRTAVQDVSKLIILLEAPKNPFLSMVKKGKDVLSELVEYTVETAADGKLTGDLFDAVTDVDSQEREKLYARPQPFREKWGVNKLSTMYADTVVADEVAHQKMHAMKRLNRRIQRSLLSFNELVAGTPSTPSQLRGLFTWLQASAQSVLPVPTSHRPTAAQNITTPVDEVTETAFMAFLKACYDHKLDMVDLDGFVGSDLKAQIDTFTIYDQTASGVAALRMYNYDGTKGTVSRNVSILKSSFGVCRLHLTSDCVRTQATGAASAYTPKSGAFVDMDMFELRHAKKGVPTNFTLADDGSGPKGYIDALLGLYCNSPVGQGYIYTNAAT